MRTSRCHGDSASGWHGLMTSQPLIVTPDMPVAAVLAQIRDPEMPVTSAAQVFVCEPPMMTPTGRVPADGRPIRRRRLRADVGGDLPVPRHRPVPGRPDGARDRLERCENPR